MPVRKLDRRLLQRALSAYVLGKDRGSEPDQKGLESPGGSPGSAGGPVQVSPRFGVPIPERLDWHRGPDIWRDVSVAGS